MTALSALTLNTTALLFLLLLTSPAYGLTEKEGRDGQFDNDEAKQQAVDSVVDQMSTSLDSDTYYGPGFSSGNSVDLTGGFRLHTRFVLYDTGSCFGEGVGKIYGDDLIQAFFNNMLPTVEAQIEDGFGFGVVVEGASDQRLLEEGLSAQFYYWVEKIGGSYAGGETPNTSEATGPSDNNTHRHDELSIITGDDQGKMSTMVNKTQGSIRFLYKTQPPKHINKTKTNNGSMETTTQKDGIEDCPPYKYALFTSLYDINILSSASRNSDFPDLIYSPSNEYFLIMQDDCNLVLYDARDSIKIPLWACGDACLNHGSGCFARINLDGTLAVYNRVGSNLWYSFSQCPSGPGCWSDTYLAVQDDGNLVLYLLDTGYPIWATGTNR